MKALTKTDFNFPGQKSVYHGKVRDVYNINGVRMDDCYPVDNMNVGKRNNTSQIGYEQRRE